MSILKPIRKSLLYKYSLLSAIFVLGSTLVACGGKKSPEPKYGLAKNEDKYLGNMISNEIPSDYLEYWNQITMENASKWGAVEWQRNTMVWEKVDAAYRFALDHNLRFNQYAFLWGSQQPNWIGGLNADGQRQEVEEFIQAYCERFPQTHLITVANAPINDPPSYAEALGGAGDTGWDWIIWGFEKAREHCPLQALILSEYYLLTEPDTLNEYMNIVNLLKERGLLDGVGIHGSALDQQNIAADELQQALDTIATSGLPIYLTQMYIRNLDLELQRSKYQELFPVVWEHPSVKGVTLWGYEKGETFENSDLMEEDGPNPALQWLQSYFESR